MALNIGLHRDGSLFGLDNFMTELRRRVWSCILQIDNLRSIDWGRPHLIHENTFDTKPPSGLDTNDLAWESHTSQATHSATGHARRMDSMARLVRRTIDLTSGPEPPVYDSVLDLDNDIRAQYETASGNMNVHAVFESFAAQPSIEVVQHLISKEQFAFALLTLHRPFLRIAGESPGYQRSRQSCIQAAYDILSVQKSFHQASSNGSEFCIWYLNGNANLHAFHAAVVILITMMDESVNMSLEDSSLPSVELKILLQCMAIYNSSRNESVIARKAIKVFDLIVRHAIDNLALHRSEPWRNLQDTFQSIMRQGSDPRPDLSLAPTANPFQLDALNLTNFSDTGTQSPLTDSLHGQIISDDQSTYQQSASQLKTLYETMFRNPNEAATGEEQLPAFEEPGVLFPNEMDMAYPQSSLSVYPALDTLQGFYSHGNPGDSFLYPDCDQK